MPHEPPGCLGFIFKAFGIGADNESGVNTQALPFQKKSYLLTRAERSFFGVLKQAMPAGYEIFCMVRIGDVLLVKKGTQSPQRYRNQINAKHLDFLICDEQAVRPMLAIELDDSSHQRASRQARDAFVDQALAAAGLPLLRVPAQTSYNVHELAEQIDAALRR